MGTADSQYANQAQAFANAVSKEALIRQVEVGQKNTPKEIEFFNALATSDLASIRAYVATDSSLLDSFKHVQENCTTILPLDGQL